MTAVCQGVGISPHRVETPDMTRRSWPKRRIVILRVYPNVPYHVPPRVRGEVEAGQALTTGVIFQTDPIPALDGRTKKEQCSWYVQVRGGRHATGIRGRSSGAGVDRAFCRDDRGLGATHSPILTQGRPRSPGKRF